VFIDVVIDDVAIDEDENQMAKLLSWSSSVGQRTRKENALRNIDRHRGASAETVKRSCKLVDVVRFVLASEQLSNN
jgi:hypothetical protein